MKDSQLLNRADLDMSEQAFTRACARSREHSALAAESLAKYGDHGPDISGCVREHFPEDVKGALRVLARQCSTECDLAYTFRPKGVRVSTIRDLGRAVARRDGSGYYGPQAVEKRGTVLVGGGLPVMVVPPA